MAKPRGVLWQSPGGCVMAKPGGVSYVKLWRCVAALVNTEDQSLRFLAQNPVDAMLAIELSPNEFMLLFNGLFEPGTGVLF